MTDSKKPAVIAPLPAASVQRICAGQAILDLTSCIKELLDNALDAGGTTINIRLFGKGGFDIVEVSDNGTGVSLGSREALALPHATSKLESLEDLQSLSSFGFRGEALFSLCHVSSRLVIATRCADERVGEQLEFAAADGTLTTRQPMARTTGTTVAVVGFLSKLPVRRKEFQQRLHAHVQKARTVVVEYALLHPGVAIRWMDMQHKVPRTVLATAQNATTLRDTMSALWGSTAVQSLVEFNVELAQEDMTTNATGDSPMIRIHGWIGPGTQRPVIGLCRRPVDWPALARALRDGFAPHVDSSHNTSVTWLVQVDMPPHLFDVNITPDKRTVLVVREAELCSAVQQQVTERVPPPPQQQKQQRRFAFVHTPTTSIQKEREDRLQRKRHTTVPPIPPAPAVCDAENDSCDAAIMEEEDPAAPYQTPDATLDDSSSDEADPPPQQQRPPVPHKRKFRHTAEASRESWQERRQWRQTQDQFNTPSTTTATLERFGFQARRTVSLSGTKELPPVANDDATDSLDADSSNDDDDANQNTVLQRQTSVVWRRPPPRQEEPPVPYQRKVSVGGGGASLPTTTAPQVWSSSFSNTASVLRAFREERQQQQTKEEHTATQQPGEDAVPLAKQEFGTMEILGQFNMGFILARTKDNSIWILDQHGCDEKYNFERLCDETVIHEQPLISPLPLELSAIQEACVLDHMSIFEQNGFRFRYDNAQPPRFRLALTALPHSGAQDGRKAVQYGRDDVIALCSLLSGEQVDGGTGTDGTGMYGNNAVRRYATQPTMGEEAETIMARLPKTIAMFASRACRNSIMIGTALSKKEMEKIVRRLADVDSPWNCPHGRPTIRRMGTLGQVLTDKTDRDEYFCSLGAVQH